MRTTSADARKFRRFWLFAVFAIIAINLFSLTHVLDNENLWRDTENHDTRTLLRETRKREETLRWFVHDWPLGNGFYRPLPTMSFILDDKLFHNDLKMYRVTTWAIALLCSLLILWFVFELFRSAWGAVGCAVVFSLWQSGLCNAIPFFDYGFYVGFGALVVSLFPARGGLWNGLLTFGLCVFVGYELSCWFQRFDIVSGTFMFRTVAWPPGRTATIMTLFVLPCLAAYCKYERTKRARWSVLSIVCLVLAFLSYEQTVVVPAALLACAVVLHTQGLRIKWTWHFIPWLMLFYYLAFHRTFLQDTRYKKQAYRGTSGALRDVWAWMFPATFFTKFYDSYLNREIGLLFVVLSGFWMMLAHVWSNICALMVGRRDWVPVFFGWAVSIGTFLPMAFQHPLSHYYYLPLVFRSIFVTWLIALLWQQLKLAVLPRESEELQQRAPAPG